MIRLYLENGVAYVWNADGSVEHASNLDVQYVMPKAIVINLDYFLDWHLLRTKHRVCGSLIGSVPSLPRQNDFQGLPMALMSEETALLLELGICELCVAKNINENPSEEEKLNIKIQDQGILDEQAEAFRKKKIEQISQKIDIIVAGKQKKLLLKGITNVHLDKQTLLQEEINKFPSLAPSQTLVHLPTEHPREIDITTVPVDILQPSVVDKEGKIRYSIFKDLWTKGYYITTGSKFGSDYLLYPGDPVRFHATYMVRCVYDTMTFFRPTNLVAFGRLSVAVNKIAVLAFCNRYGNIEYQSLQWHDSING